MPLTNGRWPEFRFDGDYVHFRMEDGNQIVNCAVTMDFLDSISQRDGVNLRHHRTIFALFRDEIERIASAKYDAGSDRPLLTSYDVPR